MFRDLLVHVDGSDAGRRRVKFAADFAKQTGARLTGLHVTPPPEVPPLYKPSLVPDVSARLSADLAASAEQAATLFTEETNELLPDACWVEAAGDTVEGVCVHARYADLVVLGQYEWQGFPEFHPLPVAHSVVLHCGRPVLVVPAAIRPHTLDRIAVAWDGSREAVRAVHDALPLLRLSRSVEIVAIISISAEADADIARLSSHLARHGIYAGAQVLRTGSDDEHSRLLKRFNDERYDLVVMGGYSHPLWQEFIFGGATQSALLSSAIPVLVSH